MHDLSSQRVDSQGRELVGLELTISKLVRLKLTIGELARPNLARASLLSSSPCMVSS